MTDAVRNGVIGPALGSGGCPSHLQGDGVSAPLAEEGACDGGIHMAAFEAIEIVPTLWRLDAIQHLSR